MYYTKKQKGSVAERKKKKTLNCRLVLHDKRNIFNNPTKNGLRIWASKRFFKRKRT